MIELKIAAESAHDLEHEMQRLGYVKRGYYTREDLRAQGILVMDTTEPVTAESEPKTDEAVKPRRTRKKKEEEDVTLPPPLEETIEADEPNDEPAVDKVMVRDAARKLGKAKGKEAVQRVLNLYGVASVGEIKESDYDAAHHDFLDAMA